MKTLYLSLLAGILIFPAQKISGQQSSILSDTYIRGGDFASENFGSDTFLIVKGHPTDLSYERRIYLRFDLDTSSTSEIYTAKLKLYPFYVFGDVSLTLSSINGEWEENSITWDNAPPVTSDIDELALTKESENKYVNWDITGPYKEALKGNGSIDLCLSDPFRSNCHVKFYSKEAVQDKQAYIEITTLTKPPVAASGVKAVSLSPNQIQLNWSDNSDNETYFVVERADTGGQFQGIDTLPVNSSQYADLNLESSSTYNYRIQSFNPLGHSEYSDTAEATTFPSSGELNYYFDASGGSDLNSGVSPDSPWKSLERASDVVYPPGSKIYFKSGETWLGTFKLQGSGQPGNPILLDKYGDGPLPCLQGPGTYLSNAMEIENIEWWEIRNLDITNKGADGISVDKYKRGIYVSARDMGAVDHLYFTNLKIHDIDGVLNSELQVGGTSKNYGGMYLEILGDSSPTWFNDLLIENCEIKNVGRTGISNQSTWWKRSLTSSFGDTIMISDSGPVLDNWVPSENVGIRDNRFENINGNGLIVRVARNALVEHNIFKFCGSTLSGNAAFCFNTDSTVFQYNDASHTIYNPGDTDARGLDSDFRTKHTIIQYNYLHHNEYGGVVATGGPGNATTVPRFNDGTIIRYNVILDNKHHIIRTSGKLTNISIYNNVFYTSAGLDDIIVAWHGSWGGAWADASYYHNNVFYHLGNNPGFNFENSTNNLFSHNAFYGEHAINEPNDPFKITEDPKMVNPAPADDLNSLEGFMILQGSPLIGNGLKLPGAPDKDLYENPITGQSLDIGVHQTLFSGTGHAWNKQGNDILVFPNPASDQIYLVPSNTENWISSYCFLDLKGRKMFTGTLSQEGNEGCMIPVSVNKEKLPAGMYIIRIEKNGKINPDYYKIIVNYP